MGASEIVKEELLTQKDVTKTTSITLAQYK